MNLSRAIDIGCVAAVSGDESNVFAAPDRLADTRFAHGLSLFCSLEFGRTHGLCAHADGLDDIVVPGAAAEIAFQFFSDGAVIEFRSLAPDKIERRHDH